MLKFFRKIRKSLIESGSVQKYILYAGGEILLVVIGILIALQINNWNEARKNEVSQRIALNGLKDEMIRNQARFDRAMTQRKRFIASCDSLILFSKEEDPELGSVGAWWRLLVNCFRYATFEPSLGQYEALVNSGRIELVENDSLRMILTTWPSAIDDLQEEERISADYVWKIHNEFLPDRVDLVNEPLHDYLNLLKDFQFTGRVSQQIRLHIITNDNSRRAEQTLQRIIILLEEEIEKLK